MNPITPRFRIPDSWTGHGACPVCRTRGRLVVVHQAIIPDHLQCGVCSSAFEVEADGSHIRLVGLPASLSSARSALLGAWLLPLDLPALIASAVEPAPHAPEAAPALPAVAEPHSPLSDEPPAEPGPAAPEPAAGIEAPPHASEPPPAVARPSIQFREPLPAPSPTVQAAAETGPELAEAPPDASDSTGLLAQLDGVGPRATGDIDAVAQLLLGLVPDDPAPAAPSPVAAAPPAPAPETAAKLTQSIQTLLYGEPEQGGPASPAAPEPLPDESTPPDQLPDGAAELAPPPPPETPTLAGPSVPDLTARALQLYQLGNTLPLIRATLERTGAPTAQVTLALEGIQAQEEQRRQRHRRAFILVGGGGFLVVLLIVLGAWIISSARAASTADPAALTAAASGPTITPGGPTLTPTRRYSLIIDLINSVIPGDVKLANGPSPTPGPTSAIYTTLFPPTATPDPVTATAAAEATAAARATLGLPPDDGLPEWARDLIPDGLTVLNVPTPSVSDVGPPASGCPDTPAEAAGLFGGDLADWSINREVDGWVVIVVGSPITLKIPANMAAGYMVFADSLEMRSALGPATITNVNFAAVSCGP